LLFVKRLLGFFVALGVVLGLLTLVVSSVVTDTSRRWFEHDVGVRSSLAVRGARRALLREWRDPNAVRQILDDITRDEKILATAACGTDGARIAATHDYPADVARVDCPEVIRRFPLSSDSTPANDGATRSVHLSRGETLVSVVPLRDEADQMTGYVVLMHDVAVFERRDASTRRVYLFGFGGLALLASLATALIGRATWTRFRQELRQTARGAPARTEFAPLLRDVRMLAERLAAETDADPAHGWSPERLKQTLVRNLHGERIVIVANREPYIHERTPDGRIEVQHPASGLVTALEPVMRACSGVWVAHGSGSADRETSDAKGRLWVPPNEKLYQTRRVWLTPEEERGYYYGFSNEGLWPLCHVAHSRPAFRARDFELYAEVNGKFAAAVADEVTTDDPIVLVQDYHLALAPRMLRDRLPRATILSFWHIPWPAAERLGICPTHAQLVRGLLGSSIVGFHTQQHCNNFLEAVDRYLEARIDREQDAVFYDGRWTLVRAYPISIEWPSRWLEELPAPSECRRSVLEEHGLGPNVMLGVGVDRLDYTKGIEERLLAVERLFEKRPDLVGKFSFIQLGAPSRTKIGAYRDLNEDIDRLVERINERFQRGSWRPVILHRAHHEPQAVFRYYRAADLCYVSSLHDGMNLVAKEFVAARDDFRGVLVLSRFTGAARELTEALIVNPYDLEEASDALETALEMGAEVQEERMRALRNFVAEWNVYRWAGRMLTDAARLRDSDRLAGRLGIEDRDRPSATQPRRARPVRLRK
jgi:trehalose 6-phosphate synthase